MKITYTEFPQQNFLFKDWEEAFKVYSEMYKIYGDEIQFVVDWNPYTSGYWIEKSGTELGGSARVYNHKQVIRLKSKIKKEIELAELELRSPRFVY